MRPFTPSVPPIALTMGDPAGIGPDVTLLAWHSRERLQLPGMVVLGDLDVLAARAKALALDVALHEVSPTLEGLGDAGNALPVLSIPVSETVEAGRPDPQNALATVKMIETGVTLIREGQVRALVTNPINKFVLYEAGFEHPGHTEFLGELASRWGKSYQPVMMLVADVLKVVPVTVHIPLEKVREALTTERIVATARIVASDLRLRFGIESPQLAIAGVNPHAGEGGSIGKEEVTIIGPAIELLKQEGLAVSGPFPADSMFHAAARSNYDAAIAMYHDQALIPIKTLAFERAVNMTLGLPFVRTSPDHGTAYDIAGTGRADPSSLVHALQLARDVITNPEPVQ